MHKPSKVIFKYIYIYKYLLNIKLWYPNPMAGLMTPPEEPV